MILVFKIMQLPTLNVKINTVAHSLTPVNLFQ